jgi:hypothetical protein
MIQNGISSPSAAAGEISSIDVQVFDPPRPTGRSRPEGEAVRRPGIRAGGFEGEGQDARGVTAIRQVAGANLAYRFLCALYQNALPNQKT